VLKLFVTTAAALCLAAPSVAVAEDHGHAVDHITCSDGTVLTPPFSPPLCKEDGGVASVTCASGATLTPPLDGKRCPAAAEGDDPGKDQHGGDGHPAPVQAGFLNRIWRIAGSADGFQDGVLGFTADRIVGLPHRFASQDDALVGQDARVLVGPRTRVVDADHHRLSGDAVASALDGADTVVIVAKLLPQAKWQSDEDGTSVPTLRAKRIIIQS
jgi:hypothetical protein